VGVRAEALANGSQHAGWICQDIVVPEAQDAPTLSLQPRVSSCIGSRKSVLPAIGLDNEPGFNAREVDNVGRNWKLAPKSST
jgi:hypothetical protein